MNIRSQVCSLQQAKRLMELGIDQSSLFYHLNGYILYGIDRDSHDAAGNEYFSAFTGTEIGVMVGENCYTWFDNGYWKCGFDVDRPITHLLGITEVQVRALDLISRLETNLLTAEEANKRLNK